MWEFYRLDRITAHHGWTRCNVDHVMDVLCRTYRDAHSAFELLCREGVVLDTISGHYKAVWIEKPDVDGKAAVPLPR